MTLKYPCLESGVGEGLLEPDENEAELISQAIRSNVTAFTRLYDIYIRRVYRHVFYRILVQDDAEDITQEVFIKAWKAVGKYEQKGIPFISWLLTIANNLIADYYKKGKKTAETKRVKAMAESVNMAVPEMDFSGAEVREAITRLKGDRQTVIVLHFIEGFGYCEIAKLLKKTEGAIRVIQYRALQELKSILY